MKIPFAAIFALALFFASCSTCRDPDSDEDQIHALIQEASALAEKHKLGDLMDLVTQDFSIQPSGWDRKKIKRTLFLLFHKLGDFSIHYPTPEVIIDPDSQNATATITLLLIRKGESKPDIEAYKHNIDSWLKKVGKNYRLYRIHLHLIKQDRQWLVQKTGFEKFRGFGFR